MSKVKIKTEKPNRFGRVIFFPILERVEFDKEGIAEVDGDKFSEYETLNSDHGIYLSEYIKGSEKKIEVNVGVTEEKEVDVEAEISSMKVAQLKETCDEAGYPIEEWEGLKKDELIKYILGKLA